MITKEEIENYINVMIDIIRAAERLLHDLYLLKIEESEEN